MLKDLMRAISLANICFVSAWADLLDSDFQIPGFNQSIAALISVIVLALIFFILITMARRSRRLVFMKVARLIFPLFLLIPLNGILRIILPEQRMVIEVGIIVAGIVMLALSDIKPWNVVFLRAATAITLIVLPFLPITFFQATRIALKFSERIVPPPQRDKPKTTTRIVWLVFDEMGQQITFSNRPNSLLLPELDRFRSQSIYSTNAHPPADQTSLSMPALINGKLITKVEGLTDLMITYAGSQDAVSWKFEPNVFSKARDIGTSTAAIGWYLPYCRYIGSSLTNCWFDDGEKSIKMSLIKQVESLINTIPLAPILESRLGVTRHIRAKNRYLGVLEGAKHAAANPNLGLILIHWPLPHPPGIYNRQIDDFDHTSESSYADNMRLVDHSLGEVRRTMEESGIWDETIVLVTSDHAWRTGHWRSTYFWTKEDEQLCPKEPDERIPFMIKLAGQQQGIEYKREFNTVLTHDLLLAMLRGEVSNPESVLKWLDYRQ